MKGHQDLPEISVTVEKARDKLHSTVIVESAAANEEQLKLMQEHQKVTEQIQMWRMVETL